MGYAPDGRDRFVDRDMQIHLHGTIRATGGKASSAILINGLAHGTWTSRFVEDRMTVYLNMFERPTRRMKNHIKERFSEVANLLGAKSMTME